MDPDIVSDLPYNLEHGDFAASCAEEWEQIDWPINGPIDLFVNQRLEVVALALVDRAMNAREKRQRLCSVINRCFLKKRDLPISDRPDGVSLATPCLEAVLVFCI